MSFWFHLNVIPTCVIVVNLTCPYVLQYNTTNHSSGCIVGNINHPKTYCIGTVTDSWRYMLSSLLPGEQTYPIWPYPGFSMIFQDEIFYESVYLSCLQTMQYMDIFIVKGALNDRYGNNPTCINFIIWDTVINAITEVSDWRIRATCFFSVKQFISSAILLNRYSDITIFQER